jgi:hypothetical protein
MDVERRVNLSVRYFLGSLRSTYRSRSISFSSIDYVESFSTDGRDDMGPLVRLVGIGVVSEVSAIPMSILETHLVKY